MSAAAILLGFLNVALYCAIIILVAFVILWVLGWMGIAISGEVLKWGKIVVGLLCLIVIVTWLLSVIGGGVSAPHFFGR
jgi:uncharacterized membrane protein (DUF485 family)